VTLHANSIAGALYIKISSKVRKLRRKRERSVSSAVSILPVKRWPKQNSSAKYQQWRRRTAADRQTVWCAFSVICNVV